MPLKNPMVETSTIGFVAVVLSPMASVPRYRRFAEFHNLFVTILSGDDGDARLGQLRDDLVQVALVPVEPRPVPAYEVADLATFGHFQNALKFRSVYVCPGAVLQAVSSFATSNP